MKKYALVVAAALLLTGCTATATTAAPTESPTQKPSAGTVTSEISEAPDASVGEMTAALTDQSLWKTEGAPNLTAESPAAAMSTPAYNSLIRQYPEPLRSAKDSEIKVVSNAICWELGAIGYSATANPVQSTMKLSKLQTLQAITLVVSQYCPSAADSIG